MKTNFNVINYIFQFKDMTDNKEALLIKKPKEDSDDTTSFEGSQISRDEYEVSAKRSRRNRRRSYKHFKTENKSFWMWFNLITAFFSGGFMVGTYFILENN